MYLNKSAERTEKIVSVPRIIEMSCRITQRRQTGMHSSNQQRCHWNLFFFFFLFGFFLDLKCCPAAKSSRAKDVVCSQVLIRGGEGRESVWMLAEIWQRAGLLDRARRGVGGEKVIYVAHKRSGDCFVKHGLNHFLIVLWRVALSAWALRDAPALLPLLRDLPSCLCWGTPVGAEQLGKKKKKKAKLSHQTGTFFPQLKSPGEPLLKAECWIYSQLRTLCSPLCSSTVLGVNGDSLSCFIKHLLRGGGSDILKHFMF